MRNCVTADRGGVRGGAANRGSKSLGTLSLLKWYRTDRRTNWTPADEEQKQLRSVGLSQELGERLGF